MEFLLVVSWILFFPDKTSYLYFLTSAVGIGFFLFKDIFFMKNIAISPFSYCLFIFNLLFILSIFFSSYRMKSVLLVSDIFLVSLYFFLSYYDRADERKYFNLILYTVSVFSLICFINSVLNLFEKTNIFFENPILQGIVSGIGVIIAIYYLLSVFKWPNLIFLTINISGIYVSGSKAAFLGTGLLVVLLILIKKKWLIPVVLILVILTFLIPNPIRNMFQFSLKYDPYAFNRFDIWKMSLDMYYDHFFTGVGLDNFSEVSKKYNFKQDRGPAHYFKIPRSPHNDYLKILAETGLVGLFLVIFLVFFIIKKIFSSSLFNLSKVLILYILLQAFFFNILFQFFFLFLFIFLLKNLFEDNLDFKTFHLYQKLTYSSLLVAIVLFSYIFPHLSESYIRKSTETREYINAFTLLNRSQALNPFTPQVYHSKAILYLNYFKKTSDMDSFYYGVENVKKAQRLNPNNLSSYLLEFDFYQSVLNKKLKYASLQEEMLDSLQRAEKIAPINPFIPLMKAQVYLEFGKRSQARKATLRALAIEPNFVSAMFLLRDQFGYYQDTESFNRKIREIGQIAIRHPYPAGSYLDNLFKIPETNH
jgi:O-antigen ligase